MIIIFHLYKRCAISQLRTLSSFLSSQVYHSSSHHGTDDTLSYNVAGPALWCHQVCVVRKKELILPGLTVKLKANDIVLPASPERLATAHPTTTSLRLNFENEMILVEVLWGKNCTNITGCRFYFYVSSELMTPEWRANAEWSSRRGWDWVRAVKAVDIHMVSRDYEQSSLHLPVFL